ncbi:ATP-dependent RNA helicase RhlE [Arenibacter nanhaiticus]|uniref:ATP-dependent RNA helicase RhlE n=1 Tax=Arenibacter nanhaiticus TaxID=558155 RepID=A0A1M6G7D9_9FLAO|nr:DEAD/DEAH box helicase [Arenibacter nanhaiticus]SHJ05885.1 ATP-dependent RNA helicase RhlE [Arenibacter nanhaiticus]
MNTFEDCNLSKQLLYAIDDLGFSNPTPIQAEAFSVIMSGSDVVGIAQTGTGKTFAYMLPILQDLKFSKQLTPRVLILVPTRELVLQVVERIEAFAKYLSVRVTGIYGGANINTQRQAVARGCDILVATPGRLYDLTLDRTLKLRDVKKLVIDEVDVMLDLGFRFQITNIFELLPPRRQNIMFSATMTDDVSKLIDDFFIAPARISIAVSGTPLENIAQSCYSVENFYTKANLLEYLLKDKTTYKKVLVFVSNKKSADRLFQAMETVYGNEACVIHSNKTQNYRIRSIKQFDEGKNRILISTDVMARGLDLDKITHVVNFDTPNYPENYMHRIGRTGRAKEKGTSVLFYTEKEREAKEAIESLMAYEIPTIDFPEAVEVSEELTPEERPQNFELNNPVRASETEGRGAAFHEKSDKNKRVNLGGSYKREIAKKYKKPKTRGDKNFAKGKKKR